MGTIGTKGQWDQIDRSGSDWFCRNCKDYKGIFRCAVCSRNTCIFCEGDGGTNGDLCPDCEGDVDFMEGL